MNPRNRASMFTYLCEIDPNPILTFHKGRKGLGANSKL